MSMIYKNFKTQNKVYLQRPPSLLPLIITCLLHANYMTQQRSQKLVYCSRAFFLAEKVLRTELLAAEVVTILK